MERNRIRFVKFEKRHFLETSSRIPKKATAVAARFRRTGMKLHRDFLWHRRQDHVIAFCKVAIFFVDNQRRNKVVPFWTKFWCGPCANQLRKILVRCLSQRYFTSDSKRSDLILISGADANLKLFCGKFCEKNWFPKFSKVQGG